MISPADVCAVVVTRGDVDLSPVVADLPYAECRVWNDLERGSRGCYGRYLAAAETDKPVIFFVDDDVRFTAHVALLAAYAPGRMTVNMPSPWYETCRYGELRQALVGAGSLVPRGLWQPAIDAYLAEHPEDELFDLYCDVVVGMLTPHLRIDVGYEVLPHAIAPGRIYTSPGAALRKETMQRRVLALRDDLEAAAILPSVVAPIADFHGWLREAG